VTEKFGTPVNDITNRAVGVAGVKDWYATPPPTLAPQVVVDVTGDPTTVVAPTTTGADARDVVEQTLPATADRSPAVPVVLGASAVAVVGIGGGLFISRRRRR
jgi:LPXTG-motif cell wall-anchored protein